MRQAINENRTVQLVLIGVLVLAAGFMLLRTRSGGGNSSAAPPSAPTASSGSSVPAAPPADSAGATQAADGSQLASAGDTIPAQMVPGPGLPRGLLGSYRHGDAIVLLVRRAGGIDDALVSDSVPRLRALAGIKVYVTKALHIARYSWLTQGVDVSELPALIVLAPRRLTDGHPTATVSYGFRGSRSVVQAVRDALYRGPTRAYHP